MPSAGLCGPWQLSLPLVRLFLGGDGLVLLQTLFSVCHRGPCDLPVPPSSSGNLLPLAAPRDFTCAQVLSAHMWRQLR